MSTNVLHSYFFVFLQTLIKELGLRTSQEWLIITRNRCRTNYRKSHARDFCGILCKTCWLKKEWKLEGRSEVKEEGKELKKMKKTTEKKRGKDREAIVRKFSSGNSPSSVRHYRSPSFRVNEIILLFRLSYLLSFSYLSVFH